MDVETLKELGLEKASNRLLEKKEMKRKLAIAYEHYRVVTPEIADRFQKALHKKTFKQTGPYGAGTYDKLAFVPLKEYPEAPAEFVLKDLKTAIDRNCFDSFEVAKIETVEVRPDPILFGRINKSEDRFFISQWDNDVKIEDILKENEG